MGLALIKSLSLVALMRVGGMGLQLVWFMLLVRFLPLEQVGIYSVVNAVWLLIRALGPLGADTAIIRQAGPLVNKGEYASIRGMARQGFRYAACLNALLYLLIAAVWMLAFPQHWPFETGLTVVIGLGCLAYLSNAISSASLLSLEKQIHAHAPESLVMPLGLILGGLALDHMDGGLTLERLLYLQAGLAGVTTLSYAALSRYFLGTAMILPDHTARKESRALGWRLFGTIALNNLSLRLPILLAPTIIGAAATALLEAAMRFGALLGVVQWCVGFVISPKISKISVETERRQLQYLLSISCWLVFLPSLVLFTLYVCFGELLLELAAGADYVAAYPALIIIAGAFLVNAASGSTTHFFTMLGHERRAFRISANEQILLLLALPSLGLSYGLEGMATALLLGMSFRNFWLNQQLHGLTGLHSALWSPQGYRFAWRLLRAKGKLP